MANFKIGFSGICAYVPGVDRSGVAKEVCILMANGRELVDPKTGRYKHLEIDSNFGSSLNRHRAFLRLSMPIPGMLGLVTETLVDLYRKRVFIEPISRSPVPLNVKGMQPQLGTGRVWRGIFQMPEVLKTEDSAVLARVNAACLEKSGEVDRVIATQVFMEAGLLTTKRPSPDEWIMDPAFQPDYGYRVLPDTEIVARYDNVDSLHITVQCLDAGSEEHFDLVEAWSLDFLNLCDSNPLMWPAKDIDVLGESRDIDFNWYYEILDRVATEWVIDNMFDGTVPVPMIAGHPNGAGNNCRPAGFAAYHY